MLKAILRIYLKRRKRHELINFMNSIEHLGRPSEVFFPPELLDQGLNLVLSGLNNTLAIQSNLHWIWPFWVEQQKNPRHSDFIPTGMNTITTNLTHRNWTSLGVKGSSEEVMIDPVGMLTAAPFSWSLFPYLKIDGKLITPPQYPEEITQKLYNDIFPNVITTYPLVPNLDWYSETKLVKIKKSDTAIFSHHLKNNSQETMHFTFGLAIRPYNVLTMGQIHELSYKKNTWKINRKRAFLLFDEPDEILLSDRHKGDPLFLTAQELTKRSLHSKTGIISGLSEYKIRLEANQEKRIESFIPLKADIRHEQIHKSILIDAEKKFYDVYNRNADKGLSFSCPDKKMERAFYALKNRIHVFDDQSRFSPGTFLYHEQWIRDSTFIALAYLNLGFHNLVKEKIENILNLQNKEGFFQSQNGEWDSNGQALFITIYYCRHSADVEFLERSFPKLYKGFLWIERMRSKSNDENSRHEGLLPAGFSAEHFGPNDHYYWDNFWALAGIRELIWAAEFLEMEKEAKTLQVKYKQYQLAVDASIRKVCDQNENCILPSSPYRKEDSASIGNLLSISPLNICHESEKWVKKTLHYLLEEHLHNGLFFQRIIHMGLNSYLSIQLIRVLLRLDDDRYMELLHTVIESGGNTYAWPEAINPNSLGGCMGDGDHGWAAAEYISIARDIFLYERNDCLILGAGLLAKWFKKNKIISVERASSIHGTVSYQIVVFEEEIEVTWSILRNPLQKKRPLYLNFYRSSTSKEKEQVQLKEDQGILKLKREITKEVAYEKALF